VVIYMLYISYIPRAELNPEKSQTPCARQFTCMYQSKYHHLLFENVNLSIFDQLDGIINEVDGKFGWGKRMFVLKRIIEKPPESIEIVVSIIFLVSETLSSRLKVFFCFFALLKQSLQVETSLFGILNRHYQYDENSA